MGKSVITVDASADGIGSVADPAPRGPQHAELERTTGDVAVWTTTDGLSIGVERGAGLHRGTGHDGRMIAPTLADLGHDGAEAAAAERRAAIGRGLATLVRAVARAVRAVLPAHAATAADADATRAGSSLQAGAAAHGR